MLRNRDVTIHLNVTTNLTDEQLHAEILDRLMVPADDAFPLMAEVSN